MHLTRSIVLISLILGLVACSTHTTAPVSDRHKARTYTYHTVKKGESLYFVSWQHGLNYLDVARWNAIKKPYHIHPGQKLRLRPYKARKKYTASRKKARTSTGVKRQAWKKQSSARKANTKKRPVKKQVERRKVAGQVYGNARVKKWIWPARGRVIRKFSAHQSGKKGISIAGKSGQSVVASASGKVVYSGNGLVRYGKMVIIKHNQKYLSAYAHNKKILVREGQYVKQGQKIALMGSTGTTRNMLHFEIRYNGKPVNPLRYIK